jgi:hypothetical protein
MRPRGDRIGWAVVAVLVAAALMVSPAGARAATITVTSTMDGSIDDVGCDLRNAIDAANANTTVGECDGDQAGADTILLQGGKTYTIERHGVDDANAEGDFDIEGPVTIKATGVGLATVDANIVSGAGGNPDADRVFDVLFESGSVVFERLKITGGLVQVPPIGIFEGGGGIFSESDLTLRESEVVGNSVSGTAFIAGGGVFTESVLGKLTIERSTIAENQVRTSNGGLSQRAVGGGIAAFNGAQALDIVNSTISGNTVVRAGGEAIPFGGGIYAGNQFDGAPVSLQSVTVTRNSAENAGGVELATATLGGTIIAGNTTASPTSTECEIRTGSTSAGANLIGAAEAAIGCNFGRADDRYGTKAVPIPPNLGTLMNNGGPTRTELPNAGSLAIGLGGSCPAVDQRGLFRTPVGPCDAGAVEVGATTSLPSPPPPPAVGTSPPPPVAGGPAPPILAAPPAIRVTKATGRRAAALKRCKAKKTRKARRNCRRRARKLPT